MPQMQMNAQCHVEQCWKKKKVGMAHLKITKAVLEHSSTAILRKTAFTGHANKTVLGTTYLY